MSRAVKMATSRPKKVYMMCMALSAMSSSVLSKVMAMNRMQPSSRAMYRFCSLATRPFSGLTKRNTGIRMSAERPHSKKKTTT